MKKLIYFIIFIVTVCSCVKKHTYKCETIHDAGGFLGVQFYTTDKTFKGTYAQMLEYVENNTDSTQVTTCK